MQDSLTLLSTFSDAGTGITKQLENNSDAFMRFGQTVDDVRERVSDNNFSASFGTNNWTWLETNFYVELGFTNFPGNTNHYEVQVHLAARLTYLGTLASAYKALLLGDQILAQSAVNNLKKGSNAVAAKTAAPTNSPTISTATATNPPPAQSTNTVENFSALAVLGFVSSIWDAWDQSRTNTPDTNQVFTQLNELYREIDASTNSTAAILLVPTIGTGLDETSMLLLSNNVIELKYHLLTNFIDTFCTKSNPPAGWSTNIQLVQFSNACYAVISNLVDTNISVSEWWQENQADRRTLMESGTLSTYSEIAYATLKSRPEAKAAPGSDNLPREWRDAFNRRHIRKNKASEPATETREAIDSTNKLIISEVTDSINRALSAGSIKSLSQSLSGLVTELQNLAASLSTYSAGVQSLLSSTIGTSGGTGTNFLNTFTNLLLDTNIFGPSLRDGLGKSLIASNKLSAEAIKDIQNLFQQSTAYEQGLENLFKNFFNEIAGIRSQLRQEDLRHDQALSLVLAKEIQRWTTLADLLTRYEGEYGKQGWLFALSRPPETPHSPGASSLPWVAISTSNRILPTLRLLAYTTHQSETAPPTNNDLGGWALIVDQKRLVASLDLLQGYFLMATFNQRYSLADQRLLHRELDEHMIQMQAIEARAHESEIELMLGDQLAFQKTGFTQADIDSLLRLAQAIGVGWIAGKQ